MSQSVNHFRIKREAHHLSRQNTNGTFNPFAHFEWSRSGRRAGRAETFPLDLEAQDDDDRGSPVAHAATAPENLASGALRDDDDEPKTDENGAVPAATKAEQDSADTGIASQSTAGDSTAVLRGRRSGAKPGSEPPADEPDDSAKGPKPKVSMFRHVEPKEPFTVANQLQRTFLNSWINVLLIAAPVGIALNFTSVTPIAIFVVNFIAIVPLAAMLSFATEEIALRTGETLGGLLNATFGYCPPPLFSVLTAETGS